MVSMALGKPPLVAMWSSPRSGGFTGPSRKALRQLISWKPATFWKAARSRAVGTGGGSNANSGEQDRVAAADGPAIDNRGVDADVHSVVLSGRPQDS